ncbi:MAG: VCBS repeat-containing protein [Planctomycetota bacterium]
MGLGYRACAVKDLDGDGTPDIISLSIDESFASTSLSARFEAYSGSTGSLIWSALAPANTNVFDLRSAGDLNGDGISDRLEHQITATGTVQATVHTTLATQAYGASVGTALDLHYDNLAAEPRRGSDEFTGASSFGGGEPRAGQDHDCWDRFSSPCFGEHLKLDSHRKPQRGCLW